MLIYIHLHLRIGVFVLEIDLWQTGEKLRRLWARGSQAHRGVNCNIARKGTRSPYACQSVNGPINKSCTQGGMRALHCLELSRCLTNKMPRQWSFHWTLELNCSQSGLLLVYHWQRVWAQQSREISLILLLFSSCFPIGQPLTNEWTQRL